MKTKYSIKNFKIFDDKGVTFNLAPITILTGSNSSGKSTMVKSLVILDDFLKKVKENYERQHIFDLTNKNIDFSVSNLKLGRFDLVLNRNASEGDPVSFSYESQYADEKFFVTLYFNKRIDDIMNNGWCERLTIKNMDEVVVADCLFNKKQGFKFETLNVAIIKRHLINSICYLTHSFLLAEEEDCINTNGKSGLSPKKTQLWHDLLNPVIGRMTDKEKNFYTNQILTEWETGNPFGFLTSINFNENPNESEFGLLLKSLACNIFFFSELCELHGLSKDRSINFLRNKAQKIKDSYIRQNIIKKTEEVLEDFNNSNKESFLDYYVSKENEYLSQLNNLNSDFHGEKSWRAINKPSVLYYLKSFYYNNTDFIVPVGYDSDGLKTESGNYVGEISRNINNELTYKFYYTPEERAKLQEDLSKKWDNLSINFETINKVLLALYDKLPDFKFETGGVYKPLSIKYFLPDMVNGIIWNLILPDTVGFMKYVAAEGVEVKRLYPTNDNSSSICRALVEYNQLSMYKDGMGGFMNKWLQKFEIAESVEFISTDEGSGFIIFVNKTVNKKDRFLLADEGYGVTQLVYLLIQIENAIAKRGFYKEKKEFSQAYYNNETVAYPYTICIEEPENHLHPKFQSLLADMFLEAYEKYNIHFIIETHSEYLIRKTQLLAAKITPLSLGTEKSFFYEKGVDSISIFYIDSKNRGKIVKQINICSDGYLDDTFGEGFYDEATRLSRRLISE